MTDAIQFQSALTGQQVGLLPPPRRRALIGRILSRPSTAIGLIILLTVIASAVLLP